MEKPHSVNSPSRVLSFSKGRIAAASASASFFDPDEKAASGFGVSWEQSPKPSEVYGFVGSITTAVATGFNLIIPPPFLSICSHAL